MEEVDQPKVKPVKTGRKYTTKPKHKNNNQKVYYSDDLN